MISVSSFRSSDIYFQEWVLSNMIEVLVRTKPENVVVRHMLANEGNSN